MPNTDHAPTSVSADLSDRERKLYGAIKYTLDRSQTDPDFGWYCGPGTQTFALLCEAEAEATGQVVSVIKVRRGVDLQPSHRRRRADVKVLRERVELLERQLEENGIAVPESES